MNTTTAEKSGSTRAFTWKSAGATSKGNVRDHNEDAILDRGEIGLWAVADGMGGHNAGDLASRLIVEALADVNKSARFSAFVDDVDDRLIGVNAELIRRAAADANQQMSGSTVAMLLAFDRFCVACWAGDSRVYRYRDGGLKQISRDHSEVQEMVERGVLTAAAAEAHASANIVTRAVGGTDNLVLDLELRELRDRDRFLICSDGLYKELSDDDMRGALATPEPRAACEALMNRALAGACIDNVSVIVVSFAAARG